MLLDILVLVLDQPLPLMPLLLQVPTPLLLAYLLINHFKGPLLLDMLTLPTMGMDLDLGLVLHYLKQLVMGIDLDMLLGMVLGIGMLNQLLLDLLLDKLLLVVLRLWRRKKESRRPAAAEPGFPASQQAIPG